MQSNIIVTAVVVIYLLVMLLIGMVDVNKNNKRREDSVKKNIF